MPISHKLTQTGTKAVGQFPCEIAIKLMSRIRRVWQTHTLPAFYSPKVGMKNGTGTGNGNGNSCMAAGMSVSGTTTEQEQRAT